MIIILLMSYCLVYNITLILSYLIQKQMFVMNSGLIQYNK